jgi:hypothetical protein
VSLCLLWFLVVVDDPFFRYGGGGDFKPMGSWATGLCFFGFSK